MKWEYIVTEGVSMWGLEKKLDLTQNALKRSTLTEIIEFATIRNFSLEEGCSCILTNDPSRYIQW